MDPREYMAQGLKKREFKFAPLDGSIDCFPIEGPNLITVSGWEAFRVIGYQERHIELTVQIADTTFVGEGDAQFQSLVIMGSVVMYSSPFDRAIRYRIHDCRQISAGNAFRNVRCPQNGVRRILNHVQGGEGYISKAEVADLLGEEPTQRALDTILETMDSALSLDR